MCTRALILPLRVLALLVGTATAAWPQALEFAARGPRFLAAWTLPGKAIDVSNAAVLRRRVSLDLTNVTADEALKEITRQAQLEIVYSPALLPTSRSVSLHARDITVAAALTEALLDAGVDVALARGGNMALVKRPEPAVLEAPTADSGAIVGRVTDKATGVPIFGAAVVIEETRQGATTASDGSYRILGVPAGMYNVRARYIGYAPMVVAVTVSDVAETGADFALQKSAQVLDEVVTTGTIVPTEVKALPTPITVVTDSEIALQRPSSIVELFRQSVPTAVGWSQPVNPTFAPFSVRGSNSLFAGDVSQMKVFIDGIEVALPSVSVITPDNIERMEVIRGPQAAAIYGSDAIGGVIQFFTKRGDPGLARPQVSAEAAATAIQTPYEGSSVVARPTFRGSLRGASADVTYNLSADYSHTGDWLPNQEAAQASYSAAGAVRYARGPIVLDLTGRYNVYNIAHVSNPDLIATGWIDFTKPYFRTDEVTNHALGAQLGVAATRWWNHTLRLGVDQYNNDTEQTRARLTTPDDTLLWVLNSNVSKTSVAYTNAIEVRLGPAVSGSLLTGFDHYRLPNLGFASFGSLTATGSIQTVPEIPISANRTITENTGYFAQAQVGFRDALFLTAGLRAERNSDFGDSLGTPVSPRVGLSYVQQVGPTRVKLRGSWGKAIRAPFPGSDGSGTFGNIVFLPNPALGPERQRGWDAGVDMLLNDEASLSFTYYDQTADDLIQVAQLQVEPQLVFQNQNIGRVENSGVEIEGTMQVGSFRARGQYGYARARVAQLVPGYEGDLRVGDQVLSTPKHTAGLTLSVTPVPRTTITAGVVYVGDWREYDYFGQFSCFAGTTPCEPTSRDYIITYPSFTKVNANLFEQIRPFLSGFISVDNLTNKRVSERSNISPVWGRTTTLGLQFRY